MFYPSTFHLSQVQFTHLFPLSSFSPQLTNKSIHNFKKRASHNQIIFFSDNLDIIDITAVLKQERGPGNLALGQMKVYVKFASSIFNIEVFQNQFFLTRDCLSLESLHLDSMGNPLNFVISVVSKVVEGSLQIFISVAHSCFEFWINNL